MQHRFMNSSRQSARDAWLAPGVLGSAERMNGEPALPGFVYALGLGHDLKLAPRLGEGFRAGPPTQCRVNQHQCLSALWMCQTKSMATRPPREGPSEESQRPLCC